MRNLLNKAKEHWDKKGEYTSYISSGEAWSDAKEYTNDKTIKLANYISSGIAKKVNNILCNPEAVGSTANIFSQDKKYFSTLFSTENQNKFDKLPINTVRKYITFLKRIYDDVNSSNEDIKNNIKNELIFLIRSITGRRDFNEADKKSLLKIIEYINREDFKGMYNDLDVEDENRLNVKDISNFVNKKITRTEEDAKLSNEYREQIDYLIFLIQAGDEESNIKLKSILGINPAEIKPFLKEGISGVLRNEKSSIFKELDLETANQAEAREGVVNALTFYFGGLFHRDEKVLQDLFSSITIPQSSLQLLDIDLLDISNVGNDTTGDFILEHSDAWASLKERHPQIGSFIINYLKTNNIEIPQGKKSVTVYKLTPQAIANLNLEGVYKSLDNGQKLELVNKLMADSAIKTTMEKLAVQAKKTAYQDVRISSNQRSKRVKRRAEKILENRTEYYNILSANIHDPRTHGKNVIRILKRTRDEVGSIWGAIKNTWNWSVYGNKSGPQPRNNQNPDNQDPNSQRPLDKILTGKVTLDNVAQKLKEIMQGGYTEEKREAIKELMDSLVNSGTQAEDIADVLIDDFKTIFHSSQSSDTDKVDAEKDLSLYMTLLGYTRDQISRHIREAKENTEESSE